MNELRLVCEIHWNNIIKVEKFIPFTSATSLKDLLSNADIHYEEEFSPLKDFITFYDSYYPFSHKTCSQICPYLIMHEKIAWNIPYSEATVEDFLRTHKIDNGVLFADSIWPESGGGGYELIEMAERWAMWASLLSLIPTLGYYWGKGRGFIQFINSKFMNQPPSPQDLYGFIYSKDRWNHHEFSSYFELINPEEAKKMLQYAGFEWDRHKMMYVKGSLARKLESDLAKIEIVRDE